MKREGIGSDFDNLTILARSTSRSDNSPSRRGSHCLPVKESKVSSLPGSVNCPLSLQS